MSLHGPDDAHRVTTWTRSSLRKSTKGLTAMDWYSSTSCVPTLSTTPMGMPRDEHGAVSARRHHVLTHLHLLVLVHVLERDVAGDAAADDALGVAGGVARLDHRVDEALLVSDEHDLRRVQIDLGDAADESLAVDHRVVHLDAVAAPRVDGRGGVPGAGGAGHDARRHQRHVLGEDLVLLELEHARAAGRSRSGS